jgi:hypothetical protein
MEGLRSKAIVVIGGDSIARQLVLDMLSRGAPM